MTEQNGTEQAETRAIKPETMAACAMARGEIPADADAAPIGAWAAKKDLSAKGNGDEQYRRRLPAGAKVWEWLTRERLPRGSYLAAERRASISGEAFPGDILASFTRSIRGGRSQGEATLDGFRLARGGEDPGMITITHVRRRDGGYTLTLPDGTMLAVPAPGWRD